MESQDRSKNAPKPKRATTSYLAFCSINRAAIKEQNPDLGFADLAKKVGAAWKELPAEEMETYVCIAKADKARYDEEMKTYVPPAESEVPGTDKKNFKPKKKRKHPDAPKKGLSSYLCFTMSMRPQLTKEHPNMTFRELAVALGQKWKALSSEEKVPFEEQAAASKKEAQAKMIEFEKKQKLQRSDGADSKQAHVQATEEEDSDSNEEGD
jgi:hypothetical protein